MQLHKGQDIYFIILIKISIGLSYIGQQHSSEWCGFQLKGHLLKEIIDINTSLRFSCSSHFAAAAIAYEKAIFCKASSCAQNPREMFCSAQCSNLQTIGPFQANYTLKIESPTNGSSCHQLPQRGCLAQKAEESPTWTGHAHVTTAHAGHRDVIRSRVKEG